MTQIRKRSENRFAALSEAGDDGQHSGHRGRLPARRRLVLVSQHGVPSPNHEWDPDTESIEGMSDVEVHDVIEPTVVPEPIEMDRVRAPGGAFSSLDAVSLSTVFERRAHVMRSVPFPMRGAMRSADQSCFAGNHQWYGVSKRVEDDPRVEAVHASAQDVVVPSSSRGSGTQETAGGSHQVVPGRTMVAVVGREFQVRRESPSKQHQEEATKRRRRWRGEEGSPCFVFGESW